MWRSYDGRKYKNDQYPYNPALYVLSAALGTAGDQSRDWAENAFVVKANLMHERVHDGSHNFSDHKKVVRSSVTLYNDLPAYNLYGVADCIEFCQEPERC